MNVSKMRRQRWLAYLLGELPEEERAAVQKEMEADATTAEHYRQVVAAMQDWATEPVEAEALAIEDLVAGQLVRPPRRYAWAWAVAAAVVLLLALSQAQFTLTWGQASLSWGRATPREVVALRTRVEELGKTVAALRTDLDKATTDVDDLALNQVVLNNNLESAVEQLLAVQQAESRRRYQDVSTLLQLAYR